MDKILFQDIQAAYVNRYQFFPVPGTTDQFDVLPIRGAVTVQGTPVRALELNQLQENVDEAKLDKSAVADYVVEQGTSGYWQYRKWKSGLSEGWFRNSYASPAFSETTGSGSLSEMALFKTSAALPSGLFAASPDVVTVAASRGTGYYPLGGYINERSKTSLSVVVWSTIAAGITDLSVELYAVGRWK